MNYLKFLVCTTLFLSACSNSDDSGKNPGLRDLEEGFKYLKSLNVHDARMIYRRGMSERSASGEGGYWKIDLSGNESKLVIEDAAGKNHDIDIRKVVKLSDRLLLIDPDVLQIQNLISPIDPDETVTIPLYGYLSIVDVETEKLYRWPNELKSILGNNYEWNLHCETDGAGNVYFSMIKPQNPPQIYKLDIQAFTIQALLPEKQEFTVFSVTDDGFIFYGNEYTHVYHVKCPAGNIIPLTGKGFCYDGKVYSVEDRKINLWETEGNSDLRKKEICPATDIGEEPPLLSNAVRNTAVFASINPAPHQPDCFWVVEFNGAGFSAPFQLPDTFRDTDLIRSPEFPVTSRAWYVFDKGEKSLHKLPMLDYAAITIPIRDYEIQHLVSDRTKPDLHFTGFRYADGKNVVGTITESDEIVIDAISESNQLIDLISIN